MQDEEEDTSCSDDTVDDDTNSFSPINTRSFDVEFIKTYERLPILWDVNHPDYANKYKRVIANDTLLELLKKYDKSATRPSVRRKINILRSCYRKDLRKHLKSKTIGPNGEEVYEYNPKNWKFYALRFLGGKVDEEIESNKKHSIVEIKLDSTFFEETTNEVSNNVVTSLHTGDEQETSLHTEDEGKRQIKSEIIIKNNKKKRMKSVVDCYDSMLDREFEAISSNVVCKLKRMNPEQRCHAELLINKVLIGGLKNTLTDETDLTEVYK